ncbi:MAG: hypothetical protein GY842_08055 [bacterium]|nr:hypothetical protein [bacterium]
MSRARNRITKCGALAAFTILLLAASAARGQAQERESRSDAPPTADERPARRIADDPSDWGGVYYIEDRRYGDDSLDYRSEPPYDRYERHWRRPARDYGSARERYDRSYRSRYYRQRGSSWRYYDDRDDRYRRPGWRYYDAPYARDYHGGGSFDRGYDEGRRDGRRYAEWERRNELGRRSYADAMSDGLQSFRGGDYSQAVRNFIRAAKINQGDPASRIHAGHAMVAIGRYYEALPALRRAFQLQPKIAYLALDIRRDYGDPADFRAHTQALRTAAEEENDDPALWLLLGYHQFYSGREADALESLTKADKLGPGDFMTEALLDAAERIAPTKHKPTKPERRKRAKTRSPRQERRSQPPDA